jgi:hypothetical protein
MRAEFLIFICLIGMAKIAVHNMNLSKVLTTPWVWNDLPKSL